MQGCQRQQKKDLPHIKAGARLNHDSLQQAGRAVACRVDVHLHQRPHRRRTCSACMASVEETMSTKSTKQMVTFSPGLIFDGRSTSRTSCVGEHRGRLTKCRLQDTKELPSQRDPMARTV